MAFDLDFDSEGSEESIKEHIEPNQVEAFVTAEVDENEDFFKSYDDVVTDFEAMPKASSNEPDIFAPSVNFKSLNQTSAEVVVGFGDTAIAWVMSDIVAKTGDIEKYKASKEERKELSDAVYRLLPDNKPIMSPKMQLLAVIAKVYGGKISNAMKDRQIAELQKKVEAQQQEIAEMKRRAEMKRHKNSMLRDQAKTDAFLREKKVKEQTLNLEDEQADIPDSGTETE